MINAQMKSIQNKKAFFDYEILDTIVAGIVLQGWEVKSIRAGNANLKSAWIKAKNGELFLVNSHISHYPFCNKEQDPNAERKLLLKKREIERLEKKCKENKSTLIPTKIFPQGKYIKCEIALGKGRKKYEKKQVLKDRSRKKEAQQTLKNFNARV